jgi:photosystem II stability/assembly factor-like uncharacterized protein
MCFIGNSGFLVSSDSIVYKSIDLGNNWFYWLIGIMQFLKDVFFINSNVGVGSRAECFI